MKKIFKILKEEGLFELINKLLLFLKYNLIDKKRFKYFAINLSDFSFSFSTKLSSLNIRIASPNDINKIKKDIYPFIGKREEYDKRFISRIGDENIIFFIMEKNNKIISYSYIFRKALESPLIKVPLKKSHLSNFDAYLGSAFTIPNERGTFIFPSILGYIIKYLLKNSKVNRLFLLVSPETAGAINFYKRLGFKEIKN